MVSDFRKKKLLHVFHTFFDVDKSGTIDRNDFDVAADKITKMKGWASGDAKTTEVKEALSKIWEGLQKRADSDGDGKITADEWIAMCDEYAKNTASPFEWQTLYMKFIFDLEDASSDGSIDSNEYSTTYASFGLNKDESVAAFNKMAKGKANVSWPEFQELWKEYFSSDDVNAAGNFIFGKTSF